MVRLESEVPDLDKKIGGLIEKSTKLEKELSEVSSKFQQVSQEEKDTVSLLREIEEIVRNCWHLVYIGSNFFIF